MMKNLFLFALLLIESLHAAAQVHISELEFKYVDDDKNNTANCLTYHKGKKFTGSAFTKDVYPETMTFIDGQLNGPYEKKDQNGGIMKKGVYVNGAFEGAVHSVGLGSKEGSFDTVFYKKGEILEIRKYYDNTLTGIQYYKTRGKKVKTKLYHQRDVTKPILVWKTTMIAVNLNQNKQFPRPQQVTQYLAHGKDIQYNLKGEKVIMTIYEANAKKGTSKLIQETKYDSE
jgi:hypothetical protein